jgi:hypothetical protein
LKNLKPFLLILLLFSLNVRAQTPRVYCTYWTGTQEVLGSLNFADQTIDPIGAIDQSTMFSVATANGYDPFRNRYYVLSNLGLVALDASNGNQVSLNPDFSIEQYKHLSYNSVTDLIYLTRFNGMVEEFFLLSPESLTVQSQGLLPYNMFVVGCYGLDPMANEVLFNGISNGVSGISTTNIATGQITGTFSKPAFIANPLLPAYDPVTNKYFGVSGIGNLKMALLEFRKSDYMIDTVGVIPGVTALGISGSAIDVVNRCYIFFSNFAVTSVSLDDPTSVQTIPYPPGVANVKGFQTNFFAAPPVVPKPGGILQSVFKNITGWYKDGQLIPGTENLLSFTPNEPGVYHYRVTRPDGAWANSNTFSITSTGNPGKEEALQLFPNPARDRFFVELAQPETSTYQLINSNGQKVLEGTLKPGKTEISLGLLPSGLYQFVTLPGSGQARRIIVE